MLRKSIIVSLSSLLMISSAQAALLTNVDGTVMVNKGEGFWQVSGITVVNAGDRVLVRGEGGAQIDYGDGCITKVGANQGAVVTSDPRCDEVALFSNTETSGSLKDVPGAAPAEAVDDRTLVIGGLIVAGGAAAAIIALSDDDKDKPASP
jgi:hypothetical protein